MKGSVSHLNWEKNWENRFKRICWSYLYIVKPEPSSGRWWWPRRLQISGYQISIGRLESREKLL
jgi:hypothetical protein